MAFPSLLSRTATGETGSQTVTFDLPATVNAGDLLLNFCVMNGGYGGLISFSEGWTDLLETDYNTNTVVGVYAKAAAGTEGGGTFDWEFSFGGAWAASHIFRFAAGTWDASGTLADAVKLSTPATASSDDAPDPSSLTVPWSGDTFWIACASADSFGTTFTAYPTNYGNGLATGDGLADILATAYRNDAAFSTQNPSAFTLSDVDTWFAFTMGIAPVSIQHSLFFGPGL